MSENEPPVVEPLAPPPEPQPAAKPAKAAKTPPRSVLIRLFGIAANFNPASPDVNIPEAIASIASQTLAAAGWAIRNFWKPALAGAGIVLPIWVLWRLVSLPFRK